jgi:hypothetical protein
VIRGYRENDQWIAQLGAGFTGSVCVKATRCSGRIIMVNFSASLIELPSPLARSGPGQPQPRVPLLRSKLTARRFRPDSCSGRG